MNESLLLAQNIETIRRNMAAYPHAKLLAATKTVPADVINEAAVHHGVCLIGENRAQELLQKYDALAKDQLEIHFIGSLQTNKVKYIADKVSMVHSLDSVKLAGSIDAVCQKLGRTMDVLIEINIAGEAAKGGVSAEELYAFYDALQPFSALRVRGLMTMGPAGASAAEYERYFTKTRDLFDRFAKDKIAYDAEPILSMGMSDSYEIALACGSNLVRVGSALFGKRAVSR
ncbi:MAG: YggS family pyridoxal phosphate-dependent enzyme [Clostridiales bacterium]|nr:YggS family pyridoxal phosphate-dependent enzyme [Clostridiales bacterium]